MKHFLLSCSTALLILSTSAQDFPEEFLGHWSGDLYWYQSGKRLPQKVKMQLIVSSTDTMSLYNWQLIYGENNKDNRPYKLYPVDTVKGHWKIDELNGIVLDQYYLGGRLTGAFSVQSDTIINSYWREKKKLVAEFYSISSKPITTTGGKNQEIPIVDSYAVKSFQKAILKKQKR